MDDRALIARGAALLVNVFTPKDGQLHAFVAAQTAEYERLWGQVDGALGNRLTRAPDGSKTVNVAYFESEAKYRAWVESDHFHDHLTRIQHLVQRVEPTLYRVLRERLKHVDGILYRCHGERIQVAEACGFESLTGNCSLPFRRAYLARDKGCGNAAPERAGTARVRSRLKQVERSRSEGEPR